MFNIRRLARVFLIIVAAALAACSNGEELPAAHGPWWALNPGQWSPTAADLTRAPK